jgi:hypothetical protein
VTLSQPPGTPSCTIVYPNGLYTPSHLLEAARPGCLVQQPLHIPPTRCSCTPPYAALCRALHPPNPAKRSNNFAHTPHLLSADGPGRLDHQQQPISTRPLQLHPASVQASLQKGQLLKNCSCKQDFLDHSRQVSGSHPPAVEQSSWRTMVVSRSEHLCPYIPLSQPSFWSREFK